MQIEKTRSNLLLVNLTAIHPQSSSTLAFSSHWRNQLMRMQQTCHAGLKLLRPYMYQGGHLCNYRWKGKKKNNHYSLSGSQILILEHMYSILLGSISSQTTKHVKKIKGEGGGQEEDKDRLERGKKKKGTAVLSLCLQQKHYSIRCF